MHREIDHGQPVRSTSAGDVRIDVRVRPGAGRSELVESRAGRIYIKLKARALEGKANQELCRLIAKALAVPVSRVELLRGKSGRDKTVQIQDADERLIRKSLSDYL